MTPDFQTTVKALVDILAQENEALERVDYAAAVLNVPAKEAALLELSRHPQATHPKTSPAPVLADSVRRLVALAGANKILLERAVAVQIRVVQIVARAAAPPKGLTHYGTKGTKAWSLRTDPVTLSERF